MLRSARQLRSATPRHVLELVLRRRRPVAPSESTPELPVNLRGFGERAVTKLGSDAAAACLSWPPPVVVTHLGSSAAAVRRLALPRCHARSPPSARWHVLVLPQTPAGNCGKRAGAAIDLNTAVFCVFSRKFVGSLAWHRLSWPAPCFGDACAVGCTVRLRIASY